jgi:hypothetical protein
MLAKQCRPKEIAHTKGVAIDIVLIWFLKLKAQLNIKSIGHAQLLFDYIIL